MNGQSITGTRSQDMSGTGTSFIRNRIVNCPRPSQNGSAPNEWELQEATAVTSSSQPTRGPYVKASLENASRRFRRLCLRERYNLARNAELLAKLRTTFHQSAGLSQLPRLPGPLEATEPPLRRHRSCGRTVWAKNAPNSASEWGRTLSSLTDPSFCSRPM